MNLCTAQVVGTGGDMMTSTGGSGNELKCVGTSPGSCSDDLCDTYQGCKTTSPASCGGEAVECPTHDEDGSACNDLWGCQTAPAGTCTEDVAECGDLPVSAEYCESYTGCYSTGFSCLGEIVLKGCGSRKSQASCQSGGFCTWTPAPMSLCQGAAIECDAMEPANCETQEGCNIVPAACSGAPTPCEDMPLSQCSTQPGCRLSTSAGVVTPMVKPSGPALQRPDLIASRFEVYRAKRNNTMDVYVDFALINRGTVSSGNHEAAFYLSEDEIIGNDDDREFHRTKFSEPVLPHGASTWTVNGFLNTSDLQEAHPHGFYYAGVIIDQLGQVAEYDEENNISVYSTRVYIGPTKFDLVAQSATHSASSTLAPNDSLTVSLVIGNESTENVPSIPVGLYLSADSTFDESDIALCTSNTALDVDPAGEVTVEVTCEIPRVRGSYKVLVRIDPLNSLLDDNLTNNVIAVADSVTVNAPSPDLSITALVSDLTSLNWKTDITFDATVQNLGIDPAGAFRVSYFLSPDTQLGSTARLICSSTVSSLAASTSSNLSQTCTLPAQAFPRAYRLIGRVDDLDDVFESAEDNNLLLASATVTVTQPNFNFRAVNVQLPSSPTRSVGQALEFGARVDNTGNVITPAGSVTVYLSSDSTITSSDEEFCTLSLAAIPSGQSDLVFTCPVPDVAAGSYYVGLIVDPENDIPEVFENDNIAHDADDKLTVE